MYSSGTVRNRGGSKKRVSIKIVVVILLICVICTTMAFLVSLLCHVYRRDRCTVQSPIFSTYKETSSGSTTNLISHRSGASSVPETKFAINSPICHITGELVLISCFNVYPFSNFMNVYAIPGLFC